MRHVGVLFQTRKGGVVHISQGAWGNLSGVKPCYYSICGEGESWQEPYAIGGHLALKQQCKRCQKSAESIAAAIGWGPKS